MADYKTVCIVNKLNTASGISEGAVERYAGERDSRGRATPATSASGRSDLVAVGLGLFRRRSSLWRTALRSMISTGARTDCAPTSNTPFRERFGYIATPTH